VRDKIIKAKIAACAAGGDYFIKDFLDYWAHNLLMINSQNASDNRQITTLLIFGNLRK
jgi:hypothetical protein